MANTSCEALASLQDFIYEASSHKHTVVDLQGDFRRGLGFVLSDVEFTDTHPVAGLLDAYLRCSAGRRAHTELRTQRSQ